MSQPLNRQQPLLQFRAFAALLFQVVLVLVLTAFALSSNKADAAYLNRYTTTTNGAIVMTGNTLGLDRTAASGSIGVFTSTNTSLQVAGYPAGTTTAWASNSSNANLTIPAGSTVLYAELIWGGGYAYGGQDVSASRNTSITFKTPSGTYSVAPQTAQDLGVAAGANCTTAPCRYVRSANVTGLIQIGGTGQYEVGGVPATAGETDANNHTAGWTLAVVYGNPSLPPRNLTLFVGAEIGGAAPTGVNGFCTNLVGPVNGRLLVSAMEGDSGISGDQMLFGPSTATMTPLSGPNNPIGNFFAGQLNNSGGSLDISGTFGSANHSAFTGAQTAAARQGWDITNVNASAALINGQTSAVAQGTTTGDQYTITTLGMQIDVGAPKFPTVVKVANRTITAVGDIVTYTVTLDNTTGTANATNVRFFDALPPGMSFRPGTVTLNGSSLPSADPVAGFLVGTVNAGTVSTVSFQVNVDAIPASPAAAEYVNKARWTYDFISCAGFPVESGSLETNPHVLPIVRLAPTKVVTPTGPVGIGTSLTYTINVPNTGTAASSGTTLTDLIPTGTTYQTGSTTLNGVAVSDVSGAMPFVTATNINSPGQSAGVIAPSQAATIVFRVTVNPGAPPVIVNTASIDPDGPGPGAVQTASATNTPLTPPVVNKSFTPSTISAGQESLVTITLSNGNAVPLTLAALSDTLPAGLVMAAVPNVSTTCGAGTAVAAPGGITLGLSNGTLPSSGTCTVTGKVTAASAGTFTNIIPVGAVNTANAGSNAASTSAVLTVLNGPTVNKSFSPSAIAPGGISSLTITLVNPTGIALTAAAVTDNLPSGVVVAPIPNISSTCGGTFAPAAGASSVSLTGGNIAASNVCSLKVDVTAASVGSYNNVIPAGALTTSGGSNASPAQADINVTAPAISKGFSPSAVGTNVATTLAITLTNTTNTAATGAAFTDVFPTTPGAMTLSSTTVSNTCGGAVTNNTGTTLAVGNVGIRLTGGTIPANGTCTVSVQVRAATGGVYVNTLPVGALTTTNSGSSAVQASASLSVGQPAVAKTFGTFAAPVVTMAAGATVPMSIQVTNPNATALTITTLTDSFPAGMTLANTTVANTCAGSLTNQSGGAFAIGATGVRLSAGSIAANTSCTLTVNVTASAPGNYTNTVAVGDVVTSSGTNAFAANASIEVLSRPTIAKVFSPSTISPNGTSLLRITLANSNAQTLTGAAFTDMFPTSPGAMTLANTTVTNTCGGTLTDSGGGAIGVGDIGLRLAGGSIPGNGTCEITATVTAAAAGTYVNTIAAGGLTTTNAGSNAAAATANLSISVQAPVISKSFNPNPVGRNVVSKLTFVITNPNVVTALTGVQFTDVLPTSPGPMLVAAVPNVATTGCGSPTVSAVANAASLSVTGATINAASTCTVSVDVVAGITGTYNNISGDVSSTNGGTGGTASSSLRVLAPPTVSKSFSLSPVAANSPSVLTVTIGNPNSGDALTSVAVSDVYPAGLNNTGSPSPTISCSPGSSAALVGGTAGGNSVGLTGGNLAAGGFCSVSINVSSASNGNYDNITGVVSSSNAGNGNTANARLNVGLTVSGKVFSDIGSSGGTPNDGILNGAEVGISGVTVRLTDCASTVYATSTTDGSGNYSLLIPASATTGTNLCVVETNLGANVSTGAMVSSVAGASYNRATDTISFTYTAGTTPSNLNFADVPPNVFNTDGAQSVSAGSSVNYPHTFIAATGGSVTFSTSAVATPTLAGWSEVIYRDTNCNGLLDAGEPVLSGAVSVTAGQTICIVVKEFVPAAAPNAAQNLVTVTASFAYTNASPTLNATYTHTDTTTVGQGGLRLIKAVDKATALPGDTLVYTITYRNDSAGAVSSVVINDNTPAFTTFQSAACGPNPPAITTCAVTSSPAVNGSGAIVWTLTGPLQPGSNSTVTFSVKVVP